MSVVVIIEGLIGAGKSTFTQALGDALGRDTLILMEPDEERGNPYLGDFYADKVRWSLTMQVHLLGMRYRMQLAAQWHAMCGLGHAVCDRSYYGDTCFARMMHRTGDISDREFETYRVIYQAMTASVLLPSACVRLRVSPEVAAERIRRRASLRAGRQVELGVNLDYLRMLDEEIDLTVNVLKGQGVKVIEVPWSTDRSSPADRAASVKEVMQNILTLDTPDLFLHHHRRTLS